MVKETETKLGIGQAEHLQMKRVEKRWEQIWNLREESLGSRKIVRFPVVAQLAFLAPAMGAITSEAFSGHYVVIDSWAALIVSDKKKGLNIFFL